MTHEARKHSEHGMSGAYRWMVCPGSVAAQRGKPNRMSEPAAKGTAVHELGEDGLRSGLDVERRLGDELTVGEFTFVVDETMVEGAQTYVDTIKNLVDPGDLLLIEQPFDLNDIYPNMFGTNDACVYKRKSRHLIVADYKNGYVLVDVEDNKQLKGYGVGAMRELRKMRLTVDRVTLMIVQPNAPHADGPVRSWDIDPLELVEFEMELRAAAVKTEDPNAPRIAGDHCDYCLAAPTCAALREAANSRALVEFAPRTFELTEAQVLQILDNADMIETWIGAVRSYAYNTLLAGGTIDGYKLVERKARRKWVDTDETTLIDALENELGVSREDATTRKLKSPAQLEKLLPAKERPRLAQYYEKKSSGYTIARDTDPRTTALVVTDPTNDFEPIGEPAKPTLLF